MTAVQWFSAGEHQVTFSAEDLPGGVYLYQIKAGKQLELGKCLLVK